ncbi:MarR family winged helix-turn-helix transcriptional regulator [Streptomyces sp. NBC_01476]|uniref:MarR family winged helix-turn-helix transcriptional regulator n=1 Tax=Streptomyces sp. NBC_01476 TaxID=2903881 RepID=UPI002E375513|nr:MarR family winged helix-turn-helix transcriptional regulator [Streptomyces sp. NBC_01476]
MSPTPPGPGQTGASAEAAAGTGLESDLGWAIRLVSGAFRKVATSSVTDLPGGPRGYLVLVAVAAGQPRSQLALAQQLALDRTVMTYLIDDLESNGLVTRRPDPADRRARQVLITAAGTTALAQARRRLGEAEARLLTDLDPAEARQLRALLERVAQTARREAITPDDDC